ncbi:VOC family protein [Peribacillus loiseleuriae]|uniref:Glyoxalase n=1 Tax=Peribacillus loiseleuriae TaxID=1679170 RepID=A0A0K9GY52_9BACI|nr:VOC family protein [Peribacillus loiseleuriae]KMY51583.1 glyoxalase [Peribacillus loiseleuriae]
MSFSFTGIHHVQLAAPPGSEEVARKFFVGILGFEEIEQPEPMKIRGGVWFGFGNYHLHIGIEEPFSPAKKAHPAFEVKNIEALKIHLAENNISFIVDTDYPGVNRIYIEDPWGNRVEILEKCM